MDNEAYAVVASLFHTHHSPTSFRSVAFAKTELLFILVTGIISKTLYVLISIDPSSFTIFDVIFHQILLLWLWHLGSDESKEINSAFII